MISISPCLKKPTKRDFFDFPGIKKLKNKKHTIGNRDIKETEIQEAETRLLDEQSWAEEALLVHPAPEHQSKRLQRILRDILQNISKATQTSAIERQTISHSSPQKLKLANLKSLTSLIPEPCPEDVSLPKWEEFAVSDVDSPEDRQYDIQFDL